MVAGTDLIKAIKIKAVLKQSMEVSISDSRTIDLFWTMELLKMKP